MPDKNYPPVGFHFVVGFGKTDNNEDGSFQEASGIMKEMGSEPVTEGGELRYQWQLPKVSNSSNLVLKRGLLVQGSELANWIQDTLESGLQKPINPKTIFVSLMGADNIPMVKWGFYNAYPVKWDFSGLDSTNNTILIETLEFAYTYFEAFKSEKRLFNQ